MCVYGGQMQHPVAAARKGVPSRCRKLLLPWSRSSARLSPALFIRHSVKMFFVSLLMARPGHYVSSPFTVFAFSFFSFCGALNSRRCVLLLCVTHSVVQSQLGRGGGLIATDQIA